MLKLPSLSDELTNKLVEVALSYDFLNDSVPKSIVFRGLKDIDIDGVNNYFEVTKKTKALYREFSMSEELQNSIKKEMTDILFPFTEHILYFQRIEGGEAVSTHRDCNRVSHLLYNISADGATTNFHNKLIDDEDRIAFSVNEVSEPIETHIFAPFKWYLFNSRKVHSVTNITKSRLAIGIDIDFTYDEVYNHFVDKSLI
jgi:hypothetical protein